MIKHLWDLPSWSLVALIGCGYFSRTLGVSGSTQVTESVKKPSHGPTSTTLNTIETSDRGPYVEHDDDGPEQAEFRNNYKEWKPRDIEKAFRDNQIIPDVVDDPPVNMSKILFPLNHSPEFGNEMDVKLHTHIDWAQWPGTLNDTYTLIYTIPDVPTRKNPASREYQVWLVGNIEGPIYIANETLTEYIQPERINGTGLHRHVFLVYKQPHARLIRFDEPYLDEKTRDDPRRYKFSTRAFTKKYNLGKPVAGNFFLAY